MLTLLLALLLAIASGCFDGRYRIISRDHTADPLIFAISAEICSLIFFAPMMCLVDTPEIGAAFCWAVLACGVLMALGWLMAVEAGRLSDLALVAPYVAITPVFMLGTSPLLEVAYPEGWRGPTGALLTAIGIYVLNKKRHDLHWYDPFSRAIADPGGRRMAFGAALFSITAPLWAIGIDISNGPVFSIAVHGLMVPCFIVFWVIKRRRNPERMRLAAGWTTVTLSLLAGFCIAGGDGMLFVSLGLVNVPLLAVIGKRLGTTIVTQGEAALKASQEELRDVIVFRVVGAAIALTGMGFVLSSLQKTL